VNCRVVGPATIGAGARLRDATVGPYVSVGPGASVTRAVVTSLILILVLDFFVTKALM
jgi:hypothetical protein